MSKEIRELLKRFNPEEWEKVSEWRETATGRAYRGGESVQEILKHKKTGVVVIRHKIIREGKVQHYHFKPASPEVVAQYGK